VWFGTDFPGAAALHERQQYLRGLAARKKCASPITPGGRVGVSVTRKVG
jgi:hypothetical protein